MQFIKDNERLMLVLEGNVCINCGDKVLVPNTTDAANEKHVPVVSFEGDKTIVNVGSVEHPMSEEHHIAWIYVETKDGGVFRRLSHTGKPYAEINVAKEEVVAVYEYCNLHGLWKIDIE